MRLFACTSCGARVFFDNHACLSCGAALGFAPAPQDMLALGADGAPTEGAGGRWRACANRADGCNWLVDAQEAEGFCVSCRLNRTIPDLSVPRHRALWQEIEAAKRHFVCNALRLGLKVEPKARDPRGLAFDFLADAPGGGPGVVTGHADGLITLNIAEADPVARMRTRDALEEPYRTLLGHFRHESGHHYWNLLVRDGPWLEPFRACFGDERQDYAEALRRHYATGTPPDWSARFISEYASSHPWEDWAESWSHYLHMVDTLETAWAFGLRLDPRSDAAEAMAAEADFNPYRPVPFQALIARWIPLTVALNALNRSMGHELAYPFTLSDAVIAKLGFVHRVARGEPPPDSSVRQ